MTQKQPSNNKSITMGSAENQPLIVEHGLAGRSGGDLSSDHIEELLGGRPIGIGGWAKLVAWESRELWRLSGASIVVSLFTYMLTFASLMFTGHLGTLPLAGASIASVGIQGLAYGIMVCFITKTISSSLIF